MYIVGFIFCIISRSRFGVVGGRVGFDQVVLLAQFSQGLARLGSGIVELAGLTDDDRPASDDEDRLEVVSTRHR